LKKKLLVKAQIGNEVSDIWIVKKKRNENVEAFYDPSSLKV